MQTNVGGGSLKGILNWARSYQGYGILQEGSFGRTSSCQTQEAVEESH